MFSALRNIWTDQLPIRYLIRPMSHLELQLNSLENRIEFNYSKTLDEINTMYRVKPRRNLQITSEKNLLNLTLNKYRMAFMRR